MDHCMQSHQGSTGPESGASPCQGPNAHGSWPLLLCNVLEYNSEMKGAVPCHPFAAGAGGWASGDRPGGGGGANPE